MPRAPHGAGKRAVQKARRDRLVKEVVERLLRVLDVQSIEETGAIFPRCTNLRKRRNRRFLCLRSWPGRVFTKKLCTRVCKDLALRLDMAREPGLDFKAFATQQAERLQRLAKKSKRVGMDNVETLPHEPCLEV